MGPGGVGDESNELVEQECRVAVLGEPAVGKTALVNRFVRGKFILVRTELDHVETLRQKKSNLLYIVISTTGTPLIFHKCQREHLVL